MTTRSYHLLDKICLSADVALRTLTGNPIGTDRAAPTLNIEEAKLSEANKHHIAGLMRINHCGEVCAQALYQGQSLTAKLPEVREKMETAAVEENDHLKWCRQRLQEINSHTSYLDPVFYAGSFAIGAIAGLAGDKWSLGFVAETERQVVAHLESHLHQLPENDERSRAILKIMKEDEQQHATTALEAGGAELPQTLRKLMSLVSKVMTRTTYHI